MATSLYWLQLGGCGGDTMSLLSAESPDVSEVLAQLDIDVLWHPSLSNEVGSQHQTLIQRLTSGESPLDILCIEGAILRGPSGTGMYDAIAGKPKKDLVRALAEQARFVIAVGTCASFGGIGSEGETEATGAQFHKSTPGGFLGKDFRSRSGLPVINLPGCPCHCEPLVGVLSALVYGLDLQLDGFQSPVDWYGTLVHQGCTRNEYHEYQVEERDFGETGCLFFHLGCHGPLVYGPCNKHLWNGRSSKTRVGVPCFGCTRPDFPQSYPFFKTQAIEEIPLQLPDGVDRAHYLAYKWMAAAAAPRRLKKRETRV